MATIKKDDIVVGSPTLPDFWLRIIRALDGTSAEDIIIKGKLIISSFSIGDIDIEVTAEELNRLAGVVPGIVTPEKVIVAGENKNLDELKISKFSFDKFMLQENEEAEIFLTPEEFMLLVGVTPGIVTPGKAMVAGENKTLDELRLGKLVVDELVSTKPDSSISTGRVYAYNTFS